MFQIYIKRTLSNTKLATIMKKTVMEQAQEKSLGEKYGTTFCSRNTVRSQTSEGNLTFFKEELTVSVQRLFATYLKSCVVFRTCK